MGAALLNEGPAEEAAFSVFDDFSADPNTDIDKVDEEDIRLDQRIIDYEERHGKLPSHVRDWTKDATKTGALCDKLEKRMRASFKDPALALDVAMGVEYMAGCDEAVRTMRDGIKAMAAFVDSPAGSDPDVYFSEAFAGMDV